MPDDLAETLPLAARLALSYAPAHARRAVLALLLLDRRLAAILTAGGEPAIAQIKLAWWRERLSEPATRWPEGEPLLALLRDWPGDFAALAGMVDGWEMLLSDRLDPPAIAQYAQGRGQGWSALGAAFGAQHARDALAATAKAWALADLLLHLGPGDDADAVRAALAGQPPCGSPLPRALRPLAVLHALTMRALGRQTADLLDGPGALLTALRVGLFGR